MSFYESSRNIWLEDGHILHAECAYGDDEWNESTIDLNDFVGNSDGWFVWNGVSKSCFLPTAHMPSSCLRPMVCK